MSTRITITTSHYKGVGAWFISTNSNGTCAIRTGSAAMDNDEVLARAVVDALGNVSRDTVIILNGEDRVDKLCFSTDYPWREAVQLIDETGVAVATWLQDPLAAGYTHRYGKKSVLAGKGTFLVNQPAHNTSTS